MPRIKMAGLHRSGLIDECFIPVPEDRAFLE